MSGVLALSVALLAFSMLLLWYTLRFAVVAPELRPMVIRGPGRMGLFSLFRLLTTVAGVAGVWYHAGFVAALLTYIATDVFRFLVRRSYTALAVRKLTGELMDWSRKEAEESGRPFDEAEQLPLCLRAATEGIQDWIRGKGE
jgi:hypothetical protein